MKRLLPLLLPLLFLTGCSTDTIADRTYAGALALSGDTLTLQPFDTESCLSVTAPDLTEALHRAELQTGGRIFIGHTELVCLDGTRTLDAVEELFFTDGLSPACKIAYAPPETLGKTDSIRHVHALRMAERNGMLPETDLTTVTDEWLGAWKTALVPTLEDPPGMVLLSVDGKAVKLTNAQIRGLCILRSRKPHLYADGNSLFLTASASEQADIREALRILHTANADVIGIEQVLAREKIPLPEKVPEISIKSP